MSIENVDKLSLLMILELNGCFTIRSLGAIEQRRNIKSNLEYDYDTMYILLCLMFFERGGKPS